MLAQSKNIISITRGLIPLIMVVLCLQVSAQSPSDRLYTIDKGTYAVDVNIFNIYDDHLIDSAYMGNSEVFAMLDSLMRDTAVINHTAMIRVVSSSSIEGRESYNRALSQRRMHSIEATFRSRYDFIAEEMWEFSSIPENWSHLRAAVASDPHLPNQQAVLSIIDNEERHPDAREYLLKILDDGHPWSYIHQHILPSSRGSVSMLLVPMAVPPVGAVADIDVPLDMPPLALPLLSSPPTYSRPIMSIRSNLLLDISSTINIGVEVPLTPRLSIAAQYVNPWWKSWDNALTWQVESLYIDLRYWLSGRYLHNTLSGWSVGAYAGSGRYDLQPFSQRGVQGEYSDFGVTLSYAHNLGRSKQWLMEYTAALGYVTTHYRHYYTAADTEEYGNIKVHNYPWSEETLRSPLPTRLGVTLVYLINVNGLKRGGER